MEGTIKDKENGALVAPPNGTRSFGITRKEKSN
jgi:hypothetical protein